jgi:Permease for cytosine/purines, uracil, thiamine, allantoin
MFTGLSRGVARYLRYSMSMPWKVTGDDVRRRGTNQWGATTLFPSIRASTSAFLPLYRMGKLLSFSLLRPSAWKLEPEPSTFAPSSAWSNKDMDPVPPDMRTWTTCNYVTYWISDAANASMWAFASSMLAIGLSWFVVSTTLSIRNRGRLMHSS